MNRSFACQVLAGLVSAGCSCAIDHSVPVDAWRADGGPGTECMDLPAGSFGVGADCTTPGEVCAQYFQGVTPDGDRAYSICDHNVCYRIDQRVDTSTGLLRMCGPDYGCSGVCVHHADGSAHCVRPCLRERTPMRACAPVSLPVLGVSLAFVPSGCDESAAHSCRLWFQSMAPPGAHALATCISESSVSEVGCASGDSCLHPDAGPIQCTCGGATCAPTELCVRNETGDPTPHCIGACWAPAGS
jgi:hypothetical protein